MTRVPPFQLEGSPLDLLPRREIVESPFDLRFEASELIADLDHRSGWLTPTPPQRSQAA